MPDWTTGDFERLPPNMQRQLRNMRRFAMGAAAVVALIWLGSGLYVVNPGEQGIIRHFGKEILATGPGLHYHLPWPVQQVDVLSLERIHRAEIGFRSVRAFEGTAQRRMSEESLMLTGDANIVDAQMIVQFRIVDPSRFLFRLRDPEENLRAAAEVSLRGAMGNATIDEALTVGRAKIQAETHTLLQRLLDDYHSGLLVTEVRLQVVDPPDQVKDAFHEVVRAREDLEKLINQARGYREDLLPKARGEAERIRRAAEGYRKERVLRAQGEADRFAALLAEYQKSPQVTRDRIYLETMTRILPKVQKVVVTDRQEGLIPFLTTPGAGGRTAAPQLQAPTPAMLESWLRAAASDQERSR